MDTQTTVPVKRAVSTAMRPMNNAFSMFRREMDRLFDDFGHVDWPSLSSGGAMVRMDMAETKDGIELTMELPGLQQKDVQVTLSDKVLTLSGEKQDEREEKEKDYRLVERSYGSFSRSITLPADAQADKIEATMADGVLRVSIPRTAKAEPKTIEVKTGA